MKLSIGMIVKNEEKHLENCLKALESLRNNVNCELIIADTGSTDRTKEIAAKYADILFDFEWCDDFSAARNSTIDRSTGDWYMFLDADEIFEDTREIEEFFNTGEYKKYHAASFVVRSYLDSGATKYLDFQGQRFFDMSQPGARFVNRIHEGIPAHPPTKAFKAFVHHWGYIKDGVLDQIKKERNMKFLQEDLEKNPNDVRTLSHLVREFSPSEEADNVIKYADLGIDALKKLRHQMVSAKQLHKNSRLVDASKGFFALYHQKIVALHNLDEYEKLIETCKEYFAGKSGVFRSDIDAYWFSGDAYYKQGKHKEAIEQLEKYLELYNQYLENGLQTVDIMYSYINCVEEDELRTAYMELITCSVETGEYDRGFMYLEKLPVDKIGQLQPAFLCMEKSGQFDYLLTLWKNYATIGNMKEIENFLYTVERRRIGYPQETRRKMSEVLARYPGEDPYHYVLLNKLRVAENEDDEELMRAYLEELMRIKPITRLLADTIYYTLKQYQDISTLFGAITVDDMKYYLSDIKLYHVDYSDVVLEYFENRKHTRSMQGLYWTVMLQETAILKDTLYDEQVLPLVKKYLQALKQYTYGLYSMGWFTEDKVEVLPGPARFAYYTERAREAEEAGDEIGYYRNMNKAVDNYKVMAKYVKLITNEHQRQREQERQRAGMELQEMKELSNQIKERIYQLYEQGDYESAKEVLKEYDAIIPGDTDLDFVRERILMGDFILSPKVPS